LVGVLGDVETGHNLTSASAAEGMTNGNSSTPWVDLFVWDSDLVDGIESLRGECLIDFIKVNIILGDAVLLQQLGDGVGGTDAHDPRGYANNRSTNKLADNGEAQLLGNRTSGEKDGSSTIGNLRRIPGVGETVLCERWLQLGQRLGGDPIPDAVILVNNNFRLLFRLGIDELDALWKDLAANSSCT